MKRIFLNLMILDAAINGENGGGTPTPEEVFESDKLTDLNGQIAELGAKMSAETVGSKQWLDINQEIYKVQTLITGEIANIKKQRLAAQLETEKNARVAMFDNAVELAIVNGIESDEFKAARETVINELLARYAGSTAAKSSNSGVSTSKSDNETKAKILELYLAGNTHKQIEDIVGSPRSTVWHTINNYKKSLEPAK